MINSNIVIFVVVVVVALGIGAAVTMSRKESFEKKKSFPGIPPLESNEQPSEKEEYRWVAENKYDMPRPQRRKDPIPMQMMWGSDRSAGSKNNERAATYSRGGMPDGYTKSVWNARLASFNDSGQKELPRDSLMAHSRVPHEPQYFDERERGRSHAPSEGYILAPSSRTVEYPLKPYTGNPYDQGYEENFELPGKLPPRIISDRLVVVNRKNNLRSSVDPVRGDLSIRPRRQ